MNRTAAALLETLFDFGDPAHAGAWEVVGDRVMGGLSRGELVLLADGWAAFQGEVLLDAGGGFASIRSAPALHDLSGRLGIELEVRGDGRAYKLSCRTDPWFDAVSYQVRFETRPGGRAVHRLPFGDFRATWRGRPVPGAPLLDPARIVSFGLLVGERQAGRFRLEIAALRAYGDPGSAS